MLVLFTDSRLGAESQKGANWDARRKKSNSCIFYQMEHLIIELSGFLASPSQTLPNLSKNSGKLSDQNRVALISIVCTPLYALIFS